MEIREHTFSVEVEKAICDLYIKIILFISEFIKNKILPELYFVESFFEALQITGKVISDQKIENIESNNNNIQVLNETKYDNYYFFIKNTFVFYVFSCKVYNTPILTRLLEKRSTKEDLCELEKYRNELEKLGNNVKQHILIK